MKLPFAAKGSPQALMARAARMGIAGSSSRRVAQRSFTFLDESSRLRTCAEVFVAVWVASSQV